MVIPKNAEAVFRQARGRPRLGIKRKKGDKERGDGRGLPSERGGGLAQAFRCAADPRTLNRSPCETAAKPLVMKMKVTVRLQC